MNIEDSLKSFKKFIDSLQDGDTITYEDDILTTIDRGCSYGCCNKGYDLYDIKSAIEELTK